MAYMTKENKKEKEVKIKKICKKYNVRGTVSIRDCSWIVLTVRSGEIDFFGSCIEKKEYDINLYDIFDTNRFIGTAKDFLSEVLNVLYGGNYDKSDSMTDYFNVGWYVQVKILSTYQLLQPAY